jgi:hypothetical protein
MGQAHLKSAARVMRFRRNCLEKYLIILFLCLVLSLGSAFDAPAQAKIGTAQEAGTKMSETRATLKRDLDEHNEKRKELQDSIAVWMLF